MANLDFFVATKDDGTSVAASIQPVTNAEPANQTSFQRPSENLRTRTQAIKESLDPLLYTAQMDKSWICVAPGGVTPTLTWTSAGGTLVSGAASTVIVPVIGGAKDGAATGYQKASYVYNSTVLIIAAKKNMYEGGGNIFVKLTQDVGAVKTIAVTGTAANIDKESVTFDITIPAVNTYQDIIDLITGNADANALLTVSSTTAGAAVHADVKTSLGTRTRLYSAPVTGLGGGIGGFDSTAYVIPQAVWANASLAMPTDGDVLAINFASLAAARAEDSSMTLAAGDFVVLKAGVKSYAGNGSLFPIAKRFQNNLYLFNGIVLKNAVLTELVLDPATQTDFNAHVAGTADKHPLKAITVSSRPIVTVGSTSGCDYTDLNLALADADLVSHGGTIYIMPGNYSLTATINLSTSKVDLIGLEGTLAPGTVTVTAPAAGGFPTITVTTAKGQRVENITFVQQAAAQNIVYNNAGAAGATPQNAVTFEKCIFYRTTNAAGVTGAYSIVTGTAMTFNQCEFWSKQVTPAGTAAADRAVSIDTTSMVGTLEVTFNQCKFWKHSECITATGANAVGLLRVQDCYFLNCGYAETVGPTWKYLISSTAVGGKFFVNGNTWDAAVDQNSECGGFCSVSGNGEIATNKLLRVVTVAYTASAYMISALRSSAPDELRVVGNTLNFTNVAGGVPAVSAIRGSHVVGNNIQNYMFRNGATHYGIFITSTGAEYKATCVDNFIEFDVTVIPLPTTAKAIASTVPANISRNRVLGMPSDFTGVTLSSAAAGSIVTENALTFGAGTTTSYGVFCDAQDTQIANNTITQPEVGVHIQRTATIVSNNRIDADPAVPATFGVSVGGTTATKCAIVGNIITDFVGGIYLDMSAGSLSGTKSVVANNVVYADNDANAYGVRIYADTVTVNADVNISGNSLIGNGATGTGILLTQGTAGQTLSYVGVGSNFIRDFAAVYSFTRLLEVGMSETPGATDADAKLHNWSL